MGQESAAAPNTVVRPVAMPLVDRIASGVVTAVPPLMVLVAMWFGWIGNLLAWQDILVLVLSYVVIGTGVTVGFHRLLTHRSFKCHRVVRAGFAALGSAAGAIYCKHRARALFVELEALNGRRDNLEIEWGQLQLEQSAWSTHAFVERVANAKLRMAMPPPKDIEIVSP